jgi:hypothetical protein
MGEFRAIWGWFREGFGGEFVARKDSFGFVSANRGWWGLAELGSMLEI